MKNLEKYFLCFLLFIIFSSCYDSQEVDYSHIKIQIQRFDHDIKDLNINLAEDKYATLKKKYPLFFDDYLKKIMFLGTADIHAFKRLLSVVDKKAYIDLQKDIDTVFPNMHKVEKALQKAFAYLKLYFPEYKIPVFYTYASGFQLQIAFGSEYIGIGLDMFLGADSRFYPSLVHQIPLYISRRFTPQYIDIKVIESIIREDLSGNLKTKNAKLLDYAIYHGKIIYALKRIFPKKENYMLLGITKEKMQWANDFESEIWGYFLEENLLYETDYLKIQKYFTETPYTIGLGLKNESAPKLAIFTGWKIVEKYMKKNPDKNMQDLLRNENSGEILKLSTYRP